MLNTQMIRLSSVFPPHNLRVCYKALEQEASKYGMSLNFAKSELLVSDPQSDAAMNFANGQPVPITTSVKYLGSVVTWDHPTETAIAARFSIARTALQSIRLVWNSRLP